MTRAMTAAVTMSAACLNARFSTSVECRFVDMDVLFLHGAAASG